MRTTINGQWKKRIVLLVLATQVVGCAAMPQGSSLAPPQTAKSRMPQDALIERVIVRDERLSAPDVVEESLTINFAQLVSEGGYFKTVKVVPEKIAQGYKLYLRFQRYNVTRRIYPLYFPAAFLTLTMYIWVGGPIFRDEVDLQADLKIEDAEGNTLVTKSAAENYSENIGLYSPKRSVWDGGQERTKLIQSLLDAAVAQLPTVGGRR